jgi:hypothetical protein
MAARRFMSKLQRAKCRANALKIPPTVQRILAACIDRLPADAKELLQDPGRNRR